MGRIGEEGRGEDAGVEGRGGVKVGGLKWGKGEGHTLLQFRLLHLVAQVCLQLALVGVGELGEVDVGLGG